MVNYAISNRFQRLPVNYLAGDDYLDGTAQVYRIKESGFHRLTGKKEVEHG